MDELWVAELGTVPYLEAVELQEGLRARRQREEIPDTLLLLEHPPVYTRGRRSEEGELSFPAEWYAERGIEIHNTTRGGKITYHGPGQLVGYPIVRIDDVLAFVRLIERAVIAALAEEEITAQVREGLTGIWFEDRKIGSIGLHVSRGVTMHGFSVNVSCDLEPFSWIVPCGIEGASVTSIAQERGSADMIRFRSEITQQFAAAIECKPQVITPEQLRIDPGVTSLYEH